MITFYTSHHVGGVIPTLQLRRKKEVEVHKSGNMKSKDFSIMTEGVKVMNVTIITISWKNQSLLVAKLELHQWVSGYQTCIHSISVH